MADAFDRLAAGYADESHVLKVGDGELLITVRGARVLACRMPGADDNLFWHPPAIESDTTGIGGGDRLWVAPEVAYYWISLEKARQDPVKWAATPEQVDPGQYESVDADDERVHLAAAAQLTDVRVKKTVSFLMDREVYRAAPPADLPDGLSVCSFAVANTLSLEDGDEGAVVGAWSLLQVPMGGTLVCPTTSRATVTSYYDDFGPRHVPVEENRVRFLVDGERRIKMGIRAEHTTGRMGYYRPLSGGKSSLILRFFAPLPGEPYVDVPRSADAQTRTGGDCLQAYADDNTFGGFGEMEHHDPALIVGQGPTSRTGTHVTHVIVGDDAKVREAGSKLLGVSVEMVS